MLNKKTISSENLLLPSASKMLPEVQVNSSSSGSRRVDLQEDHQEDQLEELKCPSNEELKIAFVEPI